MFELLSEMLARYREQVYLLLRSYLSAGRPYLLRSDLWDMFEAFCATCEPEKNLNNTADPVVGVRSRVIH